MNVAAYIRLSVEDYRKCKSNSIDNQERLIRNYIMQNTNFNFVKSYIDSSISGTTFNRPQFNILMEDIRLGKVDCIVIKDLSRLGRNFLETSEYVDDIFPKLNVRLISINDGYDSLNSTSNLSLITPIRNLMNDAYARDISKKIISSLHSKQSQGHFIGTFAPYGYKKSYVQKNRLEIDESTYKIVELIFNLLLKGHSANHVANYLNKLCIPCPKRHLQFNGLIKDYRHCLWSKSAINRIAQNHAYIGNMCQGKYHKSIYIQERCKISNSPILVEDTHEPIIGKDVFLRVRNILLERTSAYKNSLKPDSVAGSPLKGILFCGHCNDYIKIGKTYYSGKVKLRLSCPNKASPCFNIKHDDVWGLLIFIIFKYCELSYKGMQQHNRVNLYNDYLAKKITKDELMSYISGESVGLNSTEIPEQFYKDIVSKIVVFNSKLEIYLGASYA